MDSDYHDCDHLIHIRNHNQKMVARHDGGAYNHDNNCVINHHQSHTDNHVVDDEVVREYSKVCEEMMLTLLGDRNHNVGHFQTHNYNDASCNVL